MVIVPAPLERVRTMPVLSWKIISMDARVSANAVPVLERDPALMPSQVFPLRAAGSVKVGKQLIGKMSAATVPPRLWISLLRLEL